MDHKGLLVISHDICYYPQIKEKKPAGAPR
jgi:hypothetical protein